ncbi:MAG: hypothetical protein RBS51_04535 [Anaerovoracaceae bacterium]|nr:hypothetical protein [Anaerovoracaceae bacterium]
MFWPRVKSIFLNNISLFIAIFILALALAIYFPSLGQEHRLTEGRDILEQESLQIKEDLSQAVLLRDELLEKTKGLDSQVEIWKQRKEALESYLLEKPETSEESKDTVEGEDSQ